MTPMHATTPASNQTRPPLSLRRRHGAPCAAEAGEGASAPGGRQPMKAKGFAVRDRRGHLPPGSGRRAAARRGGGRLRVTGRRSGARRPGTRTAGPKPGGVPEQPVLEPGAVGPSGTRTATEGDVSPRLPHERDESSDSGTGEPREVMHRAAGDTLRGHRDEARGPAAQRRYTKLTKEHIRRAKPPKPPKP